jgi:hypothetical protein
MRLDRLVQVSVLCCFVYAENIQADSVGDCTWITGTYSFSGKLKESGGQKPINFLQLAARPSRPNVKFFQIGGGTISGEFVVRFLDDAGSEVGTEVRLRSQCNGKSWVEVDSFSGNSDGTKVSGNRIWRYRREQNGPLYVEYAESSRSEYFPGVPSLTSDARGEAEFALAEHADR